MKEKFTFEQEFGEPGMKTETNGGGIEKRAEAPKNLPFFGCFFVSFLTIHHFPRSGKTVQFSL